MSTLTGEQINALNAAPVVIGQFSANHRLCVAYDGQTDPFFCIINPSSSYNRGYTIWLIPIATSPEI